MEAYLALEEPEKLTFNVILDIIKGSITLRKVRQIQVMGGFVGKLKREMKKIHALKRRKMKARKTLKKG